ncbi:MAG: hypothetical protein CMJ27_13540 [Phycisphaerae bacterium]|nr:hypothetical protein [Phycisphaerae bacterium]OUW99908.1 MAG: hypothetical protein CBD91_07805 [Phycisphaeraceae bacterium TMED231]
MTFSIFLLLTMVAAIGVARVLRGLGLPGARIIGGLVVGIILGPAVLGRIAPDDWIRIVMGGQMERARIQEVERDHAAWRFAATAVPLPPEEFTAEAVRHREDLGPLEARLQAVETTHARPWAVLSILLAAGAAACGRASRRPLEPTPDRDDSVAAGSWAALFPALATWTVFAMTGRDAFGPEAMFTAAAVGIAGWSIESRDRRLAGEGSAFLERGSSTAIWIACGIATIAAWKGGTGWGVAGVCALPMCIPVIRQPGLRRGFRRLRDEALLPSLAAVCVLRSEFFLEVPWGLALLLIVIAGDGRWLGWYAGLRLSSAPAASPLRASLSITDVAGPQLAVAATATALGVIGPGLGFALAVSAAVIDLTSPLRRHIARGVGRPGDEDVCV